MPRIIADSKEAAMVLSGHINLVAEISCTSSIELSEGDMPRVIYMEYTIKYAKEKKKERIQKNLWIS